MGAARNGFFEVLLHAGREDATVEVGDETLHVEPEVRGQSHEGSAIDRYRLDEQRLVHFPEPALRRSGLGGLGGEFGIRVQLHVRQVPKNVAEPRAESLSNSPDAAIGGPAVRALVVAILDELDGRVCSTRQRDLCRRLLHD